jgi:hypothetical protein
MSHKDESRSIVQGPMLTVQEGVMALSKEERCRELARLVGIPLMEGEVAYAQATPWHTRRAPGMEG